MSDRYWGEPLDAQRFHIFEDGRSLCGNWMMFNGDGSKDTVTEEDVYREGKDCKTCCRKAGLVE